MAINTRNDGRLVVGAAATGAIGAALAATACCVGPLVLGILGVGGAGALALIRDYRMPLLIATAALLALGFALAYRRPALANQGSTVDPSCGCETPAARRMRSVSRSLMWISASVVLVLLLMPRAIPKLMAAMPASQGTVAAAVVPRGPAHNAVIKVGGVSCESCAIGIEKALNRIAPVRAFALDVPEQTVRFSYDGDPALGAAFASAIRNVGYQANDPVVTPAH